MALVQGVGCSRKKNSLMHQNMSRHVFRCNFQKLIDNMKKDAVGILQLIIPCSATTAASLIQRNKKPTCSIYP